VLLVKVSVLSFTRDAVAGGNPELLGLDVEEELSPQLRLRKTTRMLVQEQTANFTLNATPLCGSFDNRSIKVAAPLGPRQCPPSRTTANMNECSSK